MKATLRAKSLLALALTICTNVGYPASEEDRAAFKQVYSEYNARLEQGDYSAALQSAQQALSLGKIIAGENSKTFATLNHNYGTALLKAKHADEAYTALLETHRLYKAVHDEDAVEFIQLYLDLADAQRASDYESQWARWNIDALALARKQFGAESVDYAVLLLDLGHIELVNQGERGESHIRQGFEILEKMETRPRWDYANFVMAKVEMAHQNYGKALPYLQASIDAVKSQPANAPGTAMLMTALGFQSVALEETGQGEQATSALQEIGRIKEQLGDSSAEPVFRAKPVFPSSVNLQQTGTRLDVERNEGSVMVLFDIDQNGFTTNHRIEFSVGPQAYVDAALEALKKSRYAPLYVNGQPTVLTDVRSQYRFLINN